MTFVVTVASDVQCAHKGVAALVSSQPKLTVSGNGVVLKGDLLGALITGCTQVPPPPPDGKVPCTKVGSLTSGEATKLSVRGQGVLLDSFAATTDGKPINSLSCQAKQSKLRAG